MKGNNEIQKLVYGIDRMDGMPLTIDMIRSFYNADNLEEMLEDLVKKR